MYSVVKREQAAGVDERTTLPLPDFTLRGDSWGTPVMFLVLSVYAIFSSCRIFSATHCHARV